MANLIISWTVPGNTQDVDSIVLYKKKDALTCKETLEGEMVYETTDFTAQGCTYNDQGVPDGNWRYAAFSKNEISLSPCATSVYLVVTDTAPTVVNPLQNLTAEDLDSDLTISLTNTFEDAQGDVITKTAVSSNSSIVSVSVSGDDLVLGFNEGQGGNVTITVTAEANGKTVQDQFDVVVSVVDLCEGFSASATSSSNTEWQGGNGTINITVNAGTAPYTYSWNNGETTKDLTGLSAGVYTLTVTDNNGCVTGGSVTIADESVNPCSNFTVGSSKTDHVTWQQPDGSMTVTIFNGTSPYSYTWTKDGNPHLFTVNETSPTQTINGLGAGIYEVTVTDGNQCTANASQEIRDLSSNPACSWMINLSYSHVQPTQGSSNGSITAVAGDGRAPGAPGNATHSPSAPYTWEWKNLNDASITRTVTHNSNTDTFSNIPAGTYEIRVTEGGHGCHATHINYPLDNQ